ncbi:MAG: hypothetical protein BGO59_19870 [Spirosoma sp. 48-14]|nr:MAG: hypothetical protein BGO59_19870 [Spirosoma sp. 48-14]
MTNEHLFTDTLVSFREWASNAYHYVSRRNHLNSSEKDEALKRLREYESYLKEIFIRHSNEDCNSTLNWILRGQASMNHIAHLYEFPRYPLPDEAPDSKAFGYILFNVTDDSMEPYFRKNDEMICQSIKFIASLKPHDLIVVTFRKNYRTPRQSRVGWFDSIQGNTLFLERHDPKRGRLRPDWQISMFDVVHIWKVMSVSTDWE